MPALLQLLQGTNFGHPTCAVPGCHNPTWNGKWGECCSHTCRQLAHMLQSTVPQLTTQASLVARCARPTCPCLASWNGLQVSVAAGPVLSQIKHTSPAPSPVCYNPQFPCQLQSQSLPNGLDVSDPIVHAQLLSMDRPDIIVDRLAGRE